MTFKVQSQKFDPGLFDPNAMGFPRNFISTTLPPLAPIKKGEVPKFPFS